MINRMNLAVTTPTRDRWQWLAMQAGRLLPQLGERDQWIIVADVDPFPADLGEQMVREFGSRLTVVELSYARSHPPFGRVNRARNVAAAMAECGAAIVELDDHDLIEPGALDAIREAIDAGADYVFGDVRQQALVDCPDGRTLIETWPDVHRGYVPGRLDECIVDGLGVRAISRLAWDAVGGWNPAAWPGGDRDMATRIEGFGLRVVHLPQLLCIITHDPDGVTAKYASPRGQP